MNDVVSALGDVFGGEAIYNSAFQLSVLFVFAAAGEFVAERAGTLNISIEGMLLAGAFGASVGFHLTSVMAIAVFFGVLCGGSVSVIQGQMSHRLTANQFVVGLALNVLVLGLTAFLDTALDLGQVRAATWRIPVVADIPFVGEALFGRPWPAYLVYAFVPAIYWLTFRTRWGLEVRASGDNPQAADVSGINVNARRRQAILLAGLTSGFGGAFIVVGQVGQYQPSIINGRGFIALAAVIFGGWTLRGTVMGCIVFGLVEAATIAISVKGYSVDPFLLDSAPYVVALAVVLLFAARVRPPKALAQPFVRGLT